MQWSVLAIKSDCVCEEFFVWSKLIFLFLSLQITSTSTAGESDAYTTLKPINNGVLPEWIVNKRVHGHVGLFNMAGNPAFSTEQVQSRLNQLGVPAYTRHVKVDWRSPIWPSAVPGESDGKQSASAQSADFITPVVEAAAASEVDVIAYYWFSAEGMPADYEGKKTLQRTRYPVASNRYSWNPPEDWYCRDLAGEIIDASSKNAKQSRGFYLDITSEYREFVLRRLTELADMGVKAFYFDGLHLPRAGDSACFGSELQESYQKIGGVLPKTENQSDENFNRFLEFQASRLAETFRYWNNKINERRSADERIVFIVSGTYLSANLQPNMNLELGAASDILKVEFNHGLKWAINGKIFKHPLVKKPDDRTIISLGWIIPRDVSASKTAHIWTPALASEEEMLSYLSSTMAFGAIAAIHMNASIFSKHRQVANQNSALTKETVIQAGFSYAEMISLHLAKTKVTGEVALFLSDDYSRELGGSKSRWEGQMALVNWAYEISSKLGLSSRVVTEYDILYGDMKDVVALVAPENSMPETLRSHLSNLRPETEVVEFNSARLAYKPGFGESYHDLRKRIATIVNEKANFQVQFESNNAPAYWPHYGLHRTEQGDYILAIVNDFVTVATGEYKKPEKINSALLRIRKQPASVIDLVSGSVLGVKQDGENSFRVDIPEFQEVVILKVNY